MNFLKDLDDIIARAVNESVETDEHLRQKSQEKTIKSQNLQAKEATTQEVDEAEDADEDSKKEDPKKLKGAPKSPAKKTKEKVDKEDEVPGTATSKNLKDPTTKEIKNPGFKAIAKNINLLRGGKSIKDPDVRDNLKDYVEKLTPEERRDVLVYLNSLAQVMAGVKSGFEAEDPADAEAKADKKKVVVKDDVTQTSTSDVIMVGGE